MSALTVPSAREPVTYVDASGKTAFTRPWFLFFQNVRNLLGGGTSGGIDDLQASLAEGGTDAQLAATLYALGDEMRAAPQVLAPAPDTAIAAELNDVRAELAELKKVIEGIQQGATL